MTQQNAKASFLTALLLSIAVTTQLQAQVVIHQGDIPVEPGLVLSYFTASEVINGIEVDVGQSGEDRRWDFSEYAFDEVSNDTLLDPEEAPEHETYPNANRVIVSPTNELGINVGGGIQYEAVTDSGWFMHGVQATGGDFGFPFAFPNPLKILPLPAEFGSSWEIAAHFEYAILAPDTLLDGVLDSVIFRITVGGFSEIDGSGVLVYSGGEVPALRQHMTIGGDLTILGVRYIFNQRIEVELPFGYEIQATQTYRWLSPSMGEIVRVISLQGEEEPDFNRASSIRVRRVVPAIDFPAPPLAFGIVHVGNSGMGQIHFENHGEGVGSISRIEFTGGLENEIEVISGFPLLIERDSVVSLRCLWTPAEEKSLWPNTVSIYHNDPTEDNPFVIVLQGATPDFASVENENSMVPGELSLTSVSPNPFNSEALIRYNLPRTEYVRLSMLDPAGRLISTLTEGITNSGNHEYRLQGLDLPGGLYFIRLESSTSHSTLRAMYLQ